MSKNAKSSRNCEETLQIGLNIHRKFIQILFLPHETGLTGLSWDSFMVHLKKQSQTAKSKLNIRALLKKDYENLLRFWMAKNKANQSQFHSSVKHGRLNKVGQPGFPGILGFFA